MKKIAFSGTLDPITNGHMWVIQEARELADEVFVFISENPFKKPLFKSESRKAIVEQCLTENGWTNVSVVVVKSDYTARVAKRMGIDYLVRGIRNTADFDYENLLQQANVDILRGAKTIFVMPPRDLGSVSSSFVKALQGPVGWHWTLKKFLPKPAYTAWIIDWLRKDWNSLWQDRDFDAERATAADQWFERLIGPSSYGSNTRHYHTLDHLVHGLSEISVWAANTSASRSDVLTLKKAFWFHDAVYNEVGTMNSSEEESARLWLSTQLDLNDSEGPADLVRATDHLQENNIEHPLKDIMLSVDLAILGQADEVYKGYAAAVRAEYQHISEAVYRASRKLVLSHFLSKAKSDELFNDRYFSELYSQQSILNIEWELTNLDGTYLA